MLVIAFDTSLSGCAVALVAFEAGGGVEPGDRPRAQRLAALADETPQGQAATLVPLLQQAMRLGGRDFAALTRIGVTTGPGSFAGVRIGLATAAGLALALAIPVLGIGTLPALAAGAMAQADIDGEADPDAAVLSVIDSRRGEVFAGLYRSTPALVGGVVQPDEVLAPRLLPLTHLAAWLAPMLPHAAPLRVTGDAAIAAAQALAAAGLRPGPMLPAERVDAGCLAFMVAGLPTPTGLPEPVYLRPPDVSPPAADRHAALRRGPGGLVP